MRFPIPWAVLALGLTLSSHADAYCRTTGCGDAPPGALCVPESHRPTSGSIPADCGIPIAWDRTCIGYAVHTVGSRQIDSSTATDVLKQAFAAWVNVDCGDGSPHIELYDMGEVACGAPEYNVDAGNVNTLSFRDDDWPHQPGQLALTTVTFDVDSREIFDADIEINTSVYTFTTTPNTTDYDLLSVLTHETGHFLGLSHSEYEDTEGPATMAVDVPPGSIALRSLSNDDEAGVCVLFPPRSEPLPDVCNPISRHGYASQCGDAQVQSDCHTTGVGQRSTVDYGWLVGLGALALLRRRRARSARSRS